jgi:hypothetical protein
MPLPNNGVVRSAHKVVDRAFVAIEEKTGIIVSGDAKLLLYAAHQSLVTWFIYDRGLAGLYGLPSTRGAGMTKNKRRAEIFKYLKFAFEKSTGKTAPASCNKNGCPFSRFAHTALAIIAPPKFAPPSEKALAKAIEAERGRDASYPAPPAQVGSRTGAPV